MTQPENEKLKIISIKVSPATHHQLKIMAAHENTSGVSTMVNKLIDSAIESRKQ